MAHQAAHEAHGGHPPTTIRQYVLIGIFLTVVTAIELWLSYTDFPRWFVVGGLLTLSAVKFATVVALFMHLRFEHALFTRLFVFGLALAAAIMLALLALFFMDHWERRSIGPAEGSGGGHAAVIEAPAEYAL